MKKSRYSDSQILAILKLAEGGSPWSSFVVSMDGMPQRNRSHHGGRDYLSRYYDSESVRLINKRYAKDFRIGGYVMV
nr:hypothetical protein [Pseudodesulfovibrio tunisiensis]